MDLSAVVMMVVGMVIIWGGLAASVIYAVRKARS
ncbi:methionine/alanine import family NSS transporter small subunit [Mesobacillus boroniphilus]|uniref:Methionine/alanine import family NSS transporter small subunit n=1 Tax=Mesobacillus boroniphilus TaxID=308892 RepID=A0A944CN06_9BACI|nr:methionine/alanine import family NSS transporter small subunit [Mesobacillus boroniphilus]MBS8265969.1 methionine/alanine import family NSS transporter small subunit [Mesobacillus boroniphilus]